MMAGSARPRTRVPQFIHMNLDKSLDKPMPNFEGGKGTAMYHRGLDPTTFYTTWSYVDHLLLPPGVTAGPSTKPDMAEVYYVMSGDGTATIDGETVADPSGRRACPRRWANAAPSPPPATRRWNS